MKRKKGPTSLRATLDIVSPLNLAINAWVLKKIWRKFVNKNKSNKEKIDKRCVQKCN